MRNPNGINSTWIPTPLAIADDLCPLLQGDVLSAVHAVCHDRERSQLALPGSALFGRLSSATSNNATAPSHLVTGVSSRITRILSWHAFPCLMALSGIFLKEPWVCESPCLGALLDVLPCTVSAKAQAAATVVSPSPACHKKQTDWKAQLPYQHTCTCSDSLGHSTVTKMIASQYAINVEPNRLRSHPFHDDDFDIPRRLGGRNDSEVTDTVKWAIDSRTHRALTIQ